MQIAYFHNLGVNNGLRVNVAASGVDQVYSNLIMVYPLSPYYIGILDLHTIVGLFGAVGADEVRVIFQKSDPWKYPRTEVQSMTRPPASSASFGFDTV